MHARAHALLQCVLLVGSAASHCCTILAHATSGVVVPQEMLENGVMVWLMANTQNERCYIARRKALA